MGLSTKQLRVFSFCRVSKIGHDETYHHCGWSTSHEFICSLHFHSHINIMSKYIIHCFVQKLLIPIVLLVGVSNMFYFPFHIMGCHPSHWRTPSFFKMVKSPPTRYYVTLILLLRLLIPVLSLSLLYVIVVKFIHDQVGGQSTKPTPDSHDITVERLGCWWIPMNLSCLIFFPWKYQVGYIVIHIICVYYMLGWHLNGDCWRNLWLKCPKASP